MSSKEELEQQAERLFNEDKYAEIVELLSEAVLANHLSAALYTWRARAHSRMNEPYQATLYIEQALKLDDKFAAAYRVKGHVLHEQKQYDKALESFTKAIELSPNDAMLYNNRGTTLDDKKEYDRAIEDYTKAIELNPKYAGAYYNRGISWSNKLEYDKAIEDYTHAIEVNPNNAPAYYNRGTSYTHKMDDEKAIENYNKAIELDPGYAPAYYNRAYSYKRLENYNKALEDYTKALEFNKEDSEAVYWRDQLAEKIKEQEELQKISSYSLEKLTAELKESVTAILRFAVTIEKQPAVHYSKLLVANAILSNSDAKLRYYNAIYMNDPAEGEVIFDCFSEENQKKIRNAFEGGKKTNETSVYLGSFLTNNANDPHEDELVMWRTYGKDEHKVEAAGCSFVIDEGFFDKHDETKLLEQNALDGVFKADGSPITQGLFKVVYFKNGDYMNDEKSEIKPAMKKLEDTLAALIKIQKKDEEQKIIDGLIFKYLSRISYLFKSADYAFEHEVRIIQYMPLGTKLIQVDYAGTSAPKLYIESNKPLLPYLKKIFVGTNAPNQDHWLAYLDFQLRRNVKPDGKKYEIEIRKSECRYR